MRRTSLEVTLVHTIGLNFIFKKNPIITQKQKGKEREGKKKRTQVAYLPGRMQTCHG
jgi:hypothetical protein